MNNRWIRTLLAGMGILLYCAVAHSQSAVQALQQRLMAPPSAITLNLPELRLSRLPHAELKVVQGTPRPGILNFKLDSDEVAHQGDTLTVRNFEGVSDKKGDIIRITVATRSGASARLAIQLRRGDLAAMDEPALEQAISAVLTPQGEAPTPPASASSNSPMALSAPPSTPTNAPAQTSGNHSSKNLDLPPASPGFPPMRAMEPAPDGCWYESYFSAKFHVEFAYPQCTANHVKITDGATGPSVVDSLGNLPINMFSVYKKHADETLLAAVRRVVIANFKEVSARTGCRASVAADTSAKNPTVSVNAVGPYAKLQNHPLAKNGYACDGLVSNDYISWSFVAYPEESKTAFILIAHDEGSAVNVPRETIHFSAAEVSSAKADDTAPITKTVPEQKALTNNKGAKLPPMKSIWLSQGRTAHDLADEASTVVSFTHGMLLDSGAGDAIIAIACEKSRQGTPVLMLHAEIPVYRGMQQVLANKSGEVSVGSSRHSEQLETQPGSAFLGVVAPLNQADVAEMSANELAGQRTLSLMYFGGGGRDIAAGDLPPANEALDAVLNACHVATPARIVAQPQRTLSPDEIEHLQIAKLHLGMSEAEVKQALSPGFRFQSGDGGKFTNLSFLLAVDRTNNYGMMFFDHALRAFTLRKSFAPGEQPLVLNLIRDVTAKTWLPLPGSSAGETSWSSDANGIPITIATLNTHPNCGVVRQDDTATQPPFRNTTTVNLLDTGAECGVTVRLELSRADDKEMARDMVLMVVDYRPIHALISGVRSHAQQQHLNQRNKANQVVTPF